ncbi:hypothetical protein CFN78_01810 [Amycolatopsis antarctica]|uniref:34 kDa antigenic protein n=1 Tax=Amycolatopsis antarctica TaxID=1854586 RepID=A0A263D8X9_9PSEU|nr:DUF5336 domain-containing protein [Amycolatopsis antarctica]OZM74962.1 hypothetical protein CFN78_01810 [Amycolatopsis antarctica]
MTFPGSGQPGGGQGPGQPGGGHGPGQPGQGFAPHSGGFPQQGPSAQYGTPYGQPQPPAPSGSSPSFTKILLFVVAGLGLANLFLGFAPIGGETNFFEGFGWIPALSLLAGFGVVPALLPGGQKAGIWPPAFALAAFLPFLFTIFFVGSLGAGGIILIITLLAQAAVAVVAFLFETGIMKQSAPAPQQYGQPGGAFPPSGGYPPQGPYRG